MNICPDSKCVWSEQIKKIDGPIALQSIRAGKDLYDGIPFVFCPWCSAKLIKKEEENIFPKS